MLRPGAIVEGQGAQLGRMHAADSAVVHLLRLCSWGPGPPALLSLLLLTRLPARLPCLPCAAHTGA
jgi:hypothetical protein